jgi:type II secretory pathway pseudopilin PulG
MKLTPHIGKPGGRRPEAFTMVEVALSLAIIAFAIVAVIGILPTGMQVQRDNREETIVNQDAMLLLESLKNGQTNVTSFAENFEWIESYTNGLLEGRITRSNMLSGTFTTNDMAYRLIGLLSTPRFVPNTNLASGYVSNWVQAKFISNSGPLADRMVEDPTKGTRDFAFSYLVTVDIAPVVLSTAYSNAPVELGGDRFGAALQNNMYELRLNLSWPVYPNNSVGNGRKSFRSMVAGKLSQDTNGLYRFNPHVFNGVN